MHRVLIPVLGVLLGLSFMDAPAFARSMESGDAAIAQEAMPAVVNIAVWKVKPPVQSGDSPRRVKAYGSGFIIDPSGIIVTNKHVIDGALTISVIFQSGERVSGKLADIASRPRHLEEHPIG